MPNYDALLQGWSTIDIDAGESALQTAVAVIFDGGNSTYCAATIARTMLMMASPGPNWTITDGGPDPRLRCQFERPVPVARGR